MTDLQTPETPVNPPTVETVEKKTYDEAMFRLRATEKELTTTKTKVEELQSSASSVDSIKLELTKTKLAYQAGLPERLLTLVSGTTEEEIKAKIELIRTEFGNSATAPTPTPSSTPSDPGNQPSTPSISITPTPSGKPGESWMSKYTKATPEEKQKMMEEAKDNPGFKLS